MYENNNIFELKSRKAYPRILNDEIKLLSFDKENSTLIGSASYKIQKYPADIDLYEQVITCCNKDDAIEYFYLGIKNIVNNIRLKSTHWMIEVKCGLDDRFDIINNVTQQNLDNFLRKSINILSMKDYDDLKQLNTINSKLNMEKINNILREYYIIRWSSDEILLGWKVKQNKKFYLKDCIDTKSPINIEVIAIVDNKFTDLSNFYVVMFHDKITDTDYVVNFPQSYLTDGKKFVIEGLKQGINKVFFSIIGEDIFKGVKRIYSLSRLTDDKKLFNNISPIISSDLAQLSQIKSEIATLNEILDFTTNLPWKIFFNQIDSLKWKIGGNTMLTESEIDSLIDAIDSILSNKHDIDFIKRTLSEAKQFLLDIVNDETKKILKKIGLYKKF